MSEIYKACLVGCGRMGGTIDDEMRDRPFRILPHTHAGACNAVDQVDLVGASDVVPEKVEVLCERYGAANGYEDYRVMIEREEPAIVCIATRPNNHAEITVFAAEHGVRAIYCDKPLCGSMAEADAMLAACSRHGVKFNYGTNRRFVPMFHTMRRIVDEGEIGDLQSVTALSSSVAQWGLTHAADLLLYLAQDAQIDFVQGHITCDEADFDGEHLMTDPLVHMGYVQFANGVRGYVVSGIGYEFEISGSEGRLRTTNDIEALIHRRRGDHDVLSEIPSPPYAYESGTVNAIRDLVQALNTDSDTMGNLALACRSQEMVIGFCESHRQEGARVSLPLVNRELYVGKW